MTIDEAIVVLKAEGMTERDARSCLDHMLIRVGYGAKTLERTIRVARYMNIIELVSFFGLEGARAANVLSRKASVL